MGRPDRHHLPFPLQRFEHLELRFPIHQVMHLVNLDPPEQPEGMLCLLPAVRRAAGPDLGGDDRLIAATSQRFCQRVLGSPVHRRRIEEVDAGRQRLVNDWPAVRRRVEGLPGAHSDRGHLQRGAAELTSFQRAA